MRKLTVTQFIERSKVIHHNKYDYSKSIYITNRKSILIICPIHGEFEQTPDNHFAGKGCNKCAEIARSNFKRYTILEIQEKSNSSYDNKYKILSLRYFNKKTFVKYECPNHGIKEAYLMAFLKGHSCSECSRKKRTLTTKEFIEKASLIHQNKYTYNFSVYTKSKDKIIITCPIHGNFEQTVESHLYGQSGCSRCICSSGEKLIEYELIKNKVIYSRQKTFLQCIHKIKLRFDFAIFEDKEKTKLKCLIEFDGIQHFEAVERFGGEEGFKLTLLRDKIKNEYCLKNNLKLIRIPYFNTKNVSNMVWEMVNV